jgi:ABC-type antimicrobial peptide transport system permease subunit
MARVKVSTASLVPAFRKEVQDVDPDLPVFSVQTLDEFNRQQRWGFRVFGTLFTIFSLIALVLASVGIYAVMAYSVNQRTQEIGVHLAMGATSVNVMRLVMTRGLRQLGIGLAIGLAGAFGITRVLSGILVGVTATDPVTFTAITLVLTAASLAACLVPARRAMKVDPVVALRYE